MTRHAPVELTLRGVPLEDETLGFVRRCADRLPLRPDQRTWVLLERRPSGVVMATVAALHGSGPVVMASEDRDELLAVRNAFAMLSDRLDPGLETSLSGR